MTLSIIIVNYKTPQLCIDCLQTIYAPPNTPPLETIVVDNNSADDSRTLITTAYPQVKWIQMTYNAGFARANNEGIRQAAGDVVLLLNSDTLNVDDAIHNTFTTFSESHYIACGVQLLNPDGSAQISGNYFMRGGLNNLLALPYTGKLIKTFGQIAGVKKPHVPDATAPVEVHWINGAFLMVKKKAITRAGLMDEDFFLYAEEAEWCYRLSRVGQLVVYGQYKVIHLQGQTSNSAFASESTGYYNLYDRKGLQIMLSNFVRIRKQYGAGWFILQLLIYSFTVPVFYLIAFLKLLFSPQKGKRELQLASSFLKNVLKLWSFAGTIISNKKYFYKVL